MYLMYKNNSNFDGVLMTGRSDSSVCLTSTPLDICTYVKGYKWSLSGSMVTPLMIQICP